MPELDLFANIIPDKKSLKDAEKDIEANVEPTIEADAKKDKTAAPQKKGGGMGGMMKMGALIGGITALASILLDMKPIKKMIEVLVKIFQMFLMPFVMAAMDSLIPVMELMLMGVKQWMKFWKGGGLMGILFPESMFAEKGETTFPPLGLGGTKVPSYETGMPEDTSESISSWWTNTKNSLSNAFDSFVGFLKTVGKGLVGIGGKLKDMFMLGARTIGKWLKKAGQAIWNKIKGFGSWLWKQLKKIWDIGKAMGKGISGFGSWLWKQLKKIWNWAEALPKGISSFAQWLWNSITKALKDGMDVLGDLWEDVKDW